MEQRCRRARCASLQGPADLSRAVHRSASTSAAGRSGNAASRRSRSCCHTSVHLRVRTFALDSNTSMTGRLSVAVLVRMIEDSSFMKPMHDLLLGKTRTQQHFQCSSSARKQLPYDRLNHQRNQEAVWPTGNPAAAAASG